MTMSNETLNDFSYFLKRTQIDFQHKWLVNRFKIYSKLSLLDALTSIFNELKVENIAASPPINMLSKLPPSTLMIMKNGRMFSYEKMENDIVYLSSYNKNIIEMKIDNFHENWSDMLIIAQKNKYSGQEDFSNERKKEISNNAIIVIAAIFLSLSFITFIVAIPGLWFKLYFILSLMGLTVSILILSRENESSNLNLDKLCKSGATLDCDKVLNSKVSEIMGVKLSEIGLFYFSGLILFILIEYISINQDSNLTIVLFMFSSISALFAGFSLFYQAVILRKYCTLCLSIVFILIIQFLIVIQFQIANHSFTFEDFLILSSSFSVTPFIWFQIKKQYFGYYKQFNIISDLNFIESLDSVKLGMLSYSREIKRDVPLRFTIGNVNLENRLDVVINPNCKFCQKTINNLIAIQSINVDVFYLNISVRLEINEIGLIKIFNNYYYNYCNESVERVDFVELIFKDLSYNRLVKLEKELCNDTEIKNVNLFQDDLKVLNNLELTQTPRLIWNSKVIPSYFNNKFQKILTTLLRS